MRNFLQLSGKLLVCGTMAPFKYYEQLSERVKMHPCLYNKQEKDFKKKKEVKQSLERNSQGTTPKIWSS